MLSHNTTGAPWPRNGTQVCSSILRISEAESHRQTEKKREREWRDEMNRRSIFPLPHACCSPCRVTGVLASAVLQMQKCLKGLPFNLASKSMDQNSRVHSFVADLLRRQGAVSVWTWTHIPLQMMPEHSVLQAVHSTQNCVCNKASSGSVTSASNEFLHTACVKRPHRLNHRDTRTHTLYNYVTGLERNREAL